MTIDDHKKIETDRESDLEFRRKRPGVKEVNLKVGRVRVSPTERTRVTPLLGRV